LEIFGLMLLIVPKQVRTNSGGCMASTAVAPGTMRVVQVYKPGASIQIVEGEIPEHGPGQVRPSLVTKEEENLLACALAGDTAAFASLVMPHRDGILRLTQRILRNREDAEDAVQTAFLDAFRHLDAFQGRSRFSSWLSRIAMNAAFMKLRTSRRKNEASLDEMVERETAARFEVAEGRPNPEQEYSLKEVRLLLAKAIDRLGPLYVEVLHMFHVQELPAKEAARILGVPVGTVKARLHRARSRLRRHLQSMLARRRRPGIAKNGCTAFRSKGAFGLRDLHQPMV
jgi:RNA polymerase sigma-70 factor, ECF subfamily